jgi:RNA polymerase sigma factor (sigma-70 family)
VCSSYTWRVREDSTIFKPSSQSEKRSRKPGRKSLKEATDAQLIALCQADYAPAWDALIERYAALIYTVARRAGLPDADAQEVFQEVCLILFEHLDSLRNVERLSSWLITITRRTVWKSKRKTVPQSFSEAMPEDWMMETATTIAGAQTEATPEESVLNTERNWLVRVALAELSPACQELLTLLYVHDPPASYAEAAQKLKIPLNSISPTRSRCLQRLKEIMEKKES